MISPRYRHTSSRTSDPDLVVARAARSHTALLARHPSVRHRALKRNHVRIMLYILSCRVIRGSFLACARRLLSYYT